MNQRMSLMLLVSAVALTLPACNLLKSAARGDKITRGSLVNAADGEMKKKEREKEKVAKLEATIEEDLKEIEEQRKNGRFSSAQYRVKRMNKSLAELKKLDSGNAKLKSAPKKLGEIESTWTEEVYNKNVLVKKCAKLAEEAKSARMEENWYRVRSRLPDYAQCRRKLKDVGVEESVIAESDKIAVPEYEQYMNYLLKQATDYRKEKKFRNAVASETSIDNVATYYVEINPSGKAHKDVAKKVATIRKKYRDPEEVKAEKAKGAFESWKGNVAKLFETEWNKIEAAEKVARPLFEEGKKLAEAGDNKKAAAKLIEARKKLYMEAYPSSVAIETAIKNNALQKGLSYEISAALAKIYFEEGDKAKLYPELSIIKSGRVWLSKEQELQVRLYDLLADYRKKMSPQPTDLVRRYASRYSDTAKTYKLTKDEASAKVGEAYNMLGVKEETVSHRSAGSNPADHVGKIVKMTETISSVAGGKLRFDYRGSYKKPVKCWRTGKVAGVNLYTGRMIYEQKCKYQTVKTGYYIVTKAPKGYKLKKGDKVTFYATVGKKKGNDVNFDNPNYVIIAPGGMTKSYMGVPVKK